MTKHVFLDQLQEMKYQKMNKILLFMLVMLSGCSLEFGQTSRNNMGYVIRNSPLYCYSPCDTKPTRCFQSLDRCLIEERYDPYQGFNSQPCIAVYP